MGDLFNEGYEGGYKDGVKECEPYMWEWISVKDSLPDPEVNVLFYVPSVGMRIIRVGYIIPESHRGEVCEGVPAFWFVDDSENTAYSELDVTHWMPLPELPKEETNHE